MNLSPPFAATPEPPYYAVIFTSKRKSLDDADYERAAREMVELGSRQEGFLGIENARDKDGFGITVSYWRDKHSIDAWKQNLAHQAAQQRGRSDWYSHFTTRVARVERDYFFEGNKP